MRQLRRCQRGYGHFWVSVETKTTEINNLPLNEGDGPILLWDREITLECARCEYRIYIDSVIRTYFGVRSDQDWGT